MMADIATTDKNSASKDTTQVASQAPDDERLLVKWLEKESTSTQTILAEKKFQELLQQASQPRHVSGKACLKLCYFVEQCTKSSSGSIQGVAFSKETSLGLFNFYVEWNEKNQARSMRQVLELISSLLAQNPDKEISSCVKAVIFQQTLPLITHEAAHPLVKPSFKSLECLLGKGTVLPEELFNAYELYKSRNNLSHPIEKNLEFTNQSWDSFVSLVFYWLGPPDVSAAAGKFLVTLLKTLRTNFGVDSGLSLDHSILWQRWIRDGLSKNPHALENVKNYLFSPLFKLDRPGSLAFLQDLNQQRSISTLHSEEIDSHALVQLAAIDAGKKAGLVEEPSVIRPRETKSKKPGDSIILDEEAIGSLLANSSDTIRSLSFSVLTTSFSSIRPFSPVVLDILRPNMGLLHADTDAKFRNEVLSNTKHLIERLRGATALLAREIEQSSFKINHGDPLNSVLLELENTILHATQELLSKHREFLEWYVNFLLGELIPTSSYQRHIMALRAIHILLHSRLQGPGSVLSSLPVPANTTIWPFSLQFFNVRSMRLLLDLLMDPFEDVRSAAADILKLSDRINFMKVETQDEKKSLQHLPDGTSLSASETVQDTKWVAALCDQPPSLLTDFISKAEEASKRTGRADYADGVARSYKILYNLQSSLDARLQLIAGLVKRLGEKVSIAEKDLALAVSEAPVHGDFAALSLVSNITDFSLDYRTSAVDHLAQWEQWANLQLQMVSISSRIWNAVKDVLCNDSPEGNLPDGIDEVDTIDTKDILSYSFRAVHESSLLLNILSSNLKQNWPDQFSASIYETFRAIGNLSFTQLSSLRHRGAFSTVASTFSSSCKLSHSKALQSYASIATAASLPSSNSQLEPQISPLGQLIEGWWQETLRAIQTQSSSTRRSAGLPSLVTAIMSVADLDSHLRELVGKARDEDTDESSRVHLLNSIRAIFKEPASYSLLEPFVVDCLRLAVEYFTSSVYSLRNCGLLLFQTLANFLLGAETKSEAERGWEGDGSKISFSRYPGLLEVLLNGLNVVWSNDGLDEQVTLGLFPVLDVIRRGGVPGEHLHEFKPLIFAHLGNREWQVRELSAKAFVALTPRAHWHVAVNELSAMRVDLKDIPCNMHHGLLLAIELILRREFESNILFSLEQNSDYVEQLCNIFLRYYKIVLKSKSPEVREADIKAGNLVLQILVWRIRMNKAQDQKGTQGIPKELTGTNDRGALQGLIESFLDMSPYRSLSLAGSSRGSDNEDYDDSASYGRDSLNHVYKHPAIAIRGIYIASLRGDIRDLLRVMVHSYNVSEAVALSVLDVASSIWVVTHEEERVELLRIYKAVLGRNGQGYTYVAGKSPAVHAQALRNINDLLDGALTTDNFKNATKDLAELYERPQSIACTPDLNHQKTIFQGHYLAAQILSGGVSGDEKLLLNFASMAHYHLGHSDDVDTRHSVTAALRNIFKWANDVNFIGGQTLLPLLIVLYEALNDDDDSIRSLAASAVGHLTRKLATPLAAAAILLNHISKKYGNSLTFAHNVVERIAGRDLLVFPQHATNGFQLKEQFDQAIKPDDALFIEERQNLWIDPVRDRRRWYDCWLALPVESHGIVLGSLVEYAREGFELLAKHLSLGGDATHEWTSNHDVFSICTAIITSANAVLAAHKENRTQGHIVEVDSMLVAIEGFINQAAENSFHPQVVYELLGREAIIGNKLDELLPHAVQRMILKHDYLHGANAHLNPSPPPNVD